MDEVTESTLAHLAQRDEHQRAEITRLRAELERVRGQRDQLADALNVFDYDGHGTFLRTFGLVKVDGKWEEIEG